MKSKTCILPWIHLATSTTGYIKPCCIYKDHLKDNKGEKYNLSKNSIGEAWNCSEMKQLRTAHLKGETPDGCLECWQHEEMGKRSKRMVDNERFEHLKDRVVNPGISLNPVYFDLKLGNICNLCCRICFSGSSSGWVPEELYWLKKDDPSIDKKETSPYQRNKMGLWPENNNGFWDYMDSNIHNIEFLDFTGGEPFLIKKHWEFLDKCVQSGYAKNIKIHYNTNGTVMPDNPDIWKNFKNVEVMISVDGTEKRFEYQRHPAKWKEVESNIYKFIEMDFIHTSICHTVSAINIYYLPEFIEWFESIGLEHHQLFLNTLHGAPHYNVKVLPQHVKKIIRNRLSEYKEFDIPALLDFMDSADWRAKHWADFLFQLGRGDLYRDEDFTKTFEEFYNEVRKDV